MYTIYYQLQNDAVGETAHDRTSSLDPQSKETISQKENR